LRLLPTKRSRAACALDLSVAFDLACRRAKNGASSVAFGASLSSANILYSEHHASEPVLANQTRLAQLLRDLRSVSVGSSGKASRQLLARKIIGRVQHDRPA
jgi:hypothetical protein